MSSPLDQLVLVTGGSGFLGAYCIIALLREGYKVRTTIRSLAKEPMVRDMLISGGVTENMLPQLSFVAADLVKDEGWSDAVRGCTYVLHVASPFPPGSPKHEDDLIIPAREGALRVLRAAKQAQVRRVVLTSSFGAIGYGHPQRSEPFDEKTWTNLENSNVTPYIKSKTLAERAAWDFIESDEGEGLELAVVNPAGIFGPVLGTDFASSISLIQRIVNGEMGGCPQLSFGIIDVRDVASLHLLAMTSEKAKGERFLAVSPPAMTMQQIAMTIKERMPEVSAKISTTVLPNMLLRVLSYFNKEVAALTPELGKKKDLTNRKAATMLGWTPRSREDALVATVQSLQKYGLLKT